MNFIFAGKRITGMLSIIPSDEYLFLDEMRNFNFPVARSLKLKEVMGYDKHRIVQEGTCVSDMACAGLQSLFDRGLLRHDEFDALILITQSPDYFMPPTSCIIQGRLGLKKDLFCLDINQGCAGFLIGLIQSFLLLDQQSVRRVVLINADVLSRKVSKKDRNSYPLIGDAAAITIVENDATAPRIVANLQMDGARCEALMIPAGGFRLPCTPETAVLEDVGDNNMRSKDHLHMDGSAVFNFVQMEVPPMVESLLQLAGVTQNEVDFFLFHQPNRFMLQKLADKIKVPYDKMPSNIVEQYGNSSGVTIPMVITHNLSQVLQSKELLVCLAGFGVGLTWSSMLVTLGGLQFCEIIQYKEGGHS
jgi:3-oxoacyl-[acyl-carrier-protein] synthase-3